MSVQQPVIVLDVNETLSDLAAARGAVRRGRCAEPAHARLWFAAVLRDGFALSIADVRPVLRRRGPRGCPDAALTDPRSTDRSTTRSSTCMDGIQDAAAAPRRGPRRYAGSRPTGFRTGHAEQRTRPASRTGSSSDAGLLDARGAAALGGGAHGRGSRHATAYGYAAAQLRDLAPWDMVLVASHPWDVDGAIRAGAARRSGSTGVRARRTRGTFTPTDSTRCTAPDPARRRRARARLTTRPAVRRARP